MVYEQMLPLRDKHKLTPDAATQLASKVKGKPVHMGYSADRLEGRVGEKPLGHVASADVAEQDGVSKVRVLVQLDENDPVAVQAHASLESGECGLGLDATIKTKGRELGAEERIVSVIGVTGLNVVPMDAESAYTGQLHES